MAANYKAYVNSYEHLKDKFAKYEGNKSKEEWGKQHWKKHGKEQGLTLPGKGGTPVTPLSNSESQTFYTSGFDWGNGLNIQAGTYSQQEYDTLSAGILLQLQGNIDTQIADINKAAMLGAAGINAGASVNVANIQADANKYMAQLDLEAKKYLADKDYLKGVDIEKIRGQSALDLQAIINAGMKEVEGIRGQTAKDVANIQGEFGVKQESERQAGQKEIARIGEQSSFRNALVSAFSF